MRMSQEAFDTHQRWKNKVASTAHIDAFVATEAAKRAPKYHNVPTDGYASKKEAKRAAELKLLEQAGEIFQLSEQVKFVLIPKQAGERECSYIADFAYVDHNNQYVVEDAKGMRTPTYIIKRKLMLMVHGIAITEV